MVEVQLTNRDKGFQWFSGKGIFVKGMAFSKDNFLLEGKTLLDYFDGVRTIEAFILKLSGLNGMFSVIIADGEHVIAASDALRNFPILYNIKEKTIRLSDHYCTFTKEKRNLNQESVRTMRHMGYVMGNDTLIEGIHQIQGGEYLFFDGEKAEIKRWHQLPDRPDLSYSYENRKEAFKKTLSDITARLALTIGNRPVALPLSGGFDSRLIGLLLKKAGIQNVTCFTYGNPEHRETKTSKEIARKLGFRWMIVDYKEYIFQNYLLYPDFNEYVDFIANAISFPYLQEFFAARYLKSGKIFADNTLFIPGHSGDMLAGSHLHPDMKQFESKQDLARKIFRNNGQQLPFQKKESQFILQKIEENTFPELYHFTHLSHDDWNITQRQSKQIVNSSKVWTFFGYQYILPLWDKDLIELFSGMPFEYRLYKKLYDEVLMELFEENGLLSEEEKKASGKERKRTFLKIKLKEYFPFMSLLKPPYFQDCFYFKELLQTMLKKMPPMKYNQGNAILSAWYIQHLTKQLEDTI